MPQSKPPDCLTDPERGGMSIDFLQRQHPLPVLPMPRRHNAFRCCHCCRRRRLRHGRCGQLRRHLLLPIAAAATIKRWWWWRWWRRRLRRVGGVPVLLVRLVLVVVVGRHGCWRAGCLGRVGP